MDGEQRRRQDGRCREHQARQEQEQREDRRDPDDAAVELRGGGRKEPARAAEGNLHGQPQDVLPPGVEQHAVHAADLDATGNHRAAQEAPPAVAAERETLPTFDPVPVRFRGEVLSEIRAPIGGLDPAQRAAAIADRITAAAGQPSDSLNSIRIGPSRECVSHGMSGFKTGLAS